MTGSRLTAATADVSRRRYELRRSDDCCRWGERDDDIGKRTLLGNPGDTHPARASRESEQSASRAECASSRRSRTVAGAPHCPVWRRRCPLAACPRRLEGAVAALAARVAECCGREGMQPMSLWARLSRGPGKHEHSAAEWVAAGSPLPDEVRRAADFVVFGTAGKQHLRPGRTRPYRASLLVVAPGPRQRLPEAHRGTRRAVSELRRGGGRPWLSAVAVSRIVWISVAAASSGGASRGGRSPGPGWNG